MAEQDVDIQAERRAVDAVRTMLGLGGLVALVLGILILVNPVKTGATMMLIVTVIVALYMVGSGAVYLGTAVFSKSMRGWPRTGHALLGLLYVVAGIILFSNIQAGAVMLAVFLSVLIGVMWIFEGVIAFSSVKSTGSKGLTIFYGIISVIAGLVLIFSPMLGAVTLWVLIAVSMIVMGAMQIVRAFSVK